MARRQLVDTVDFRLALQPIRGTGCTAMVGDRAFALYVELFDYADAAGDMPLSSVEMAETFQISRMTWLLYRDVLVDARLLEVGELHGGRRRTVQLIAPD